MAGKKTKPSNLPGYRNPPLNEVVLGLRFAPLERLMIPHIGLFWGSIQKEFPNCEHAAPLSFDPSSSDTATGLPVPRVWLINRPGDRLIQIQRDVFFYNWRQRDENRPYTRHTNIAKSFYRYFNLFDTFIRDNNIGQISIKEVELTYINQIIQSQGWETPRDIGKVFPDFNWRSSIKRFLPVPDGISWRASFPLPDGKGLLKVKVDQGRRRVDETPVLVFELRAIGIGADKSLDGIREWLATAHEWIVRGFADLTGTKVQEEIWKRDDSFTD